MKPIFALVVLALAAQPARAQEPDLLATVAAPRTVNGLYPLWEQTGELHAPGALQIGWQFAQLGLGRVQLGTQPFLDAYGTANAQLKLGLLQGARLRLALAAGYYDVPTNARSKEVGNLHTVGFSNPYAPVELYPVALAGTYIFSPRLRVHAATTALFEWSDDRALRQVSFGAAALCELRASLRWAAMMHLGLEGLPIMKQSHLGLSFAYRLSFLDLRAGYARRFDEGESANLILFDGALVF